MARYDGLIIPRSYSEYINKTDAATLLQALQLSGVMDNAPTANSNHPTKSGGVYTALAGKQPTLTFDNVPTEDSDNPVKSGGIYDALGTKQDALTFDDTPTANSNNPVKSGGIYTEIRGIKSFYVLFGTPQTFKIGTWGSFIVLANIDGAGNTAFLVTVSNNTMQIQSLGNETMSRFMAPTITDNVITAGTESFYLKISIANGVITLEKTGTAGAHVTIISGGSEI